MPIAIKDVGTLQAKYLSRGSNAVNEYKAGINAPKASQSTSAIAAADRWQQALADPNAKKRFTTNLQKAGDAGWQAGALGKGANNYPAGIQRGAPKWGSNVQPYLQVIAGLTLPPKGVRGNTANVARVAAIADALHAKKLSMSGG
jgi:hypothetical protein